LRFLAVVLYIGYLVNIGLLLVMLPWSRAWGRLLTMLPLGTAAALDQPWFRGVMTAFGVLHLMLVVLELVHPTLLTPGADRASGSQDVHRS
jgi:hypothetical protein